MRFQVVHVHRPPTMSLRVSRITSVYTPHRDPVLAMLLLRRRIASSLKFTGKSEITGYRYSRPTRPPVQAGELAEPYRTW